MTVLIREIVSEIVLTPAERSTPGAPPRAAAIDEAVIESIIGRASARVLEELRLEWDV